MKDPRKAGVLLFKHFFSSGIAVSKEFKEIFFASEKAGVVVGHKRACFFAEVNHPDIFGLYVCVMRFMINAWRRYGFGPVFDDFFVKFGVVAEFFRRKRFRPDHDNRVGLTHKPLDVA